MDNKELDKSRAEFEAWAFPDFKAGRNEKGSYSDRLTWSAWCGWSAALARRSLPVDAAGIRTWRERLLPGYEECDEREARDAEVAELRAALARAGSAAPTGQQAEPVAIMQRFPDDQLASQAYTPVRPAWLGSMPPVGAKLYTAPVSAAPAAPTDKIEEIQALLSEAHDFKSTSKAAQDNINAALDLLDGIAAPTAAEGPSEQVIGGQRWSKEAEMMKSWSKLGQEGAGEADAKDAARYRGWRDNMLAQNQDFVDAMQGVLPPDVGESREPTADEWDCAIDAAIAAQPKDTTDTKEKA